MRIANIILFVGLVVAWPLFADIVVDDKFPGGNIIVLKQSEGKVELRQDQRDTKGEKWFYWAFRVKGAAGKTITFEFPDKEPGGGPVGVRGPVVSKDDGETFALPLDGKSDKCSFTYTFGKDENVTYFYECYPYVMADWMKFVSRHWDDFGKVFVIDTLCKSRKGADVPRARFGCIGVGKTPKYRALITARHHCSETSASWVLEGVAEAFFAKDELGAWLRENVELMMVPFMDYDGVQAGDQGKKRAPHDHNRDYTEFIYPETKALTEWVKSYADAKLDLFMDVHCPWIRGPYNEFLYTPWKSPEIIPNAEGEKFFSETLEKMQCGSFRYKASDDLQFGNMWNKGLNYSQGASAVMWFAREYKCLKLCRSFEVPFANANGAVVTPEACRDLGRDVAKVWKELLLNPAVGYELDVAASDEFEGVKLDDTRWDDWVWSFQGRRQGFMFTRDNVAVTNGCLELTARVLREDEKTVENLRRGFDKYATAIVKAKRKTHYGYYECRAKTMKACVCNAFWLYDPLSDSPAKFKPGEFSDEIDIFEIFGAVGQNESLSKPCQRICYQTVHCLATPYLEAICNSGAQKLPDKTTSHRVDFDFWADYHVFGFLWTEKELVWYVDGKETFRRVNDRFKRPMHVTFDCEIMFGWVGEPLHADLPAVFSVDYFRYWKPAGL